jgi:FkbM family methyltransferase
MQGIVKKPAPFVLTASGHGTLIVNKNDFHAVDGGAYGVGHELFETSYFDVDGGNVAQYLMAKRYQSCKENLLVIDAGANIGVHTVDWARFLTGHGQVIAIEAQERIFYALAGNIAINNVFNASAIYAALGDTLSHVTIPSPDYCKPGSFGSFEIQQRANGENIGQPIDYSKGKSVKMITIDSMALDRLDYLKLDIEGMELEALHGAKKTILKYKPIMGIECIKLDIATLKELLQSWGYLVCQIGINMYCVHSGDVVLFQIRQENQLKFI